MHINVITLDILESVNSIATKYMGIQYITNAGISYAIGTLSHILNTTIVFYKLRNGTSPIAAHFPG